MGRKKIKLNPVVSEHLPTTFEEWVSIHGEPEYIGEENQTTYTKGILIKTHFPEEDNYDTSDIIYYDKKDNPQIDYKKFVDAFAHKNNCVFCNGVFYNPDGEIPTTTIRRDIAHSIGDCGWRGKIDSPTNSIFTTLKDMYSVESLPVNTKVIPLANGDLHIEGKKWVFHEGLKEHAPYRLSVDYIPREEPTPLFNKWLNDVFHPEDIPTVQEIMGYCLVPSTAAGEAFFIVGDGGAGKSGLGTILLGMLGNASTTTEIQNLATDRFQTSELENKLLLYDDDLGSAALSETGVFKKIVTADTPIRAERKYVDAHHFKSYCRVLASTNIMISSLYDDSDGFRRRLHPIVVKPKEPNRKTINNFYAMILENEKEQILKWALEGLRRVMANGWKISWSQRSIDYMRENKSNTVHFEDFFQETCEVVAGEELTSSELISLYKKWCKENGIKECSDRRLTNWLADNLEKLGVVRTRNIMRNGKQVRGYFNVKIKPEWKSVTISL